MPSFSVILTTHDRANLLDRAIRSAKMQEDASVQVIVVADRACKATHSVVSSLLSDGDLFLQRSGIPGPAESRNMGLNLATGDHVVFLDDDDVLSLDFLRQASEYVDGRSVLYADFFSVLERLDDGAPMTLGSERRSLAGARLDELYIKNFIPFSCLVYPRTLLAGKTFDPSLVLNEDWDFILNVMSTSPLRHAPIGGPIITTRTSSDNRGRTNDHMLISTYLQIYGNRPAPSLEQKLARQSFFRSVGLDLSLDVV